MALDEDKLMEFVGAVRRRPRRDDGRRQRRRRRPARALPRAGRRDRPGAAELAERTDTDPRYVEEWLRGQAAGGYVTYDAERRRPTR